MQSGEDSVRQAALAALITILSDSNSKTHRETPKGLAATTLHQTHRDGAPVWS